MGVFSLWLVDIESLTVHSKFQDHQSSGHGSEKDFKFLPIYRHGGNFDHVTTTIFKYIHDTPSQGDPPTFGLNWQSGCREDI